MDNQIKGAIHVYNGQIWTILSQFGQDFTDVWIDHQPIVLMKIKSWLVVYVY